MDKFYDIKEAAKILHTTAGNLRQMNLKRVIPYYNPTGRKCLYKECDLEKYLNSVRVASAEEIASKAALYCLK